MISFIFHLFGQGIVPIAERTRNDPKTNGFQGSERRK